MSFGTAVRAMQAANIRHFGGGARCTLRRRHTVMRNGELVKTFAAAAALAGATTLTITQAGAKGALLAGVEISIAGHAAPYLTTATAEAVAGALVLSISPALSGAVALNDVVTVTRDYVPESYGLLRGHREKLDQEGSVVGDSERLHLTATATSREPQPGDLVEITGERLRAVVSSRTVAPGAVAGRYEVTLGEGAT